MSEKIRCLRDFERIYLPRTYAERLEREAKEKRDEEIRKLLGEPPLKRIRLSPDKGG